MIAHVKLDVELKLLVKAANGDGARHHKEAAIKGEVLVQKPIDWPEVDVFLKAKGSLLGRGFEFPEEIIAEWVWHVGGSQAWCWVKFPCGEKGKSQ